MNRSTLAARLVVLTALIGVSVPSTGRSVPALQGAELKLAGVFGDHMVLQRDQPVPVWGWADADEQVTVQFAGQRKITSADTNGEWLVKLDPVPASAEGRELLVQSKTQNRKAKISDVLVGEVWLASGQSNMGWWLKDTTTAAEAIPKANDPLLRLGWVGAPLAETPQPDANGCKWSVCTPEKAATFSAVGYVFGRELRQALNVPVGIVVNAWPASSAEAWTPLKTLQASPDLRPYLEKSEQAIAEYVSGVAGRRHEARMAKYREEAAKAEAEGRPAPKEPAPLHDPREVPWRPSVLYNSRIAPLMPFAIRGVIWYQAEGNNGDPARYETLFPAMIRSWREGWGEPALPFLFVQLPACKNTTPLMREVQARCARRVPNAAMVVTLDVGEAENIHPRNKEPVGLRLALKARALVYGEKVEHSGPVFTAVQVQDGSLVLSFEHAGGLRARDGELCGFEVAGADGRFFAARAKIEGEAVRLTCAKAKSPTQVRYAWANVPDANLVNAAGLPAEPFQSAP